MKLILNLLMMVAIINQKSYAQETAKPQSLFDLPANVFEKSFSLDLGNKNKMTVEFTDLQDLNSLMNMDSLLQVFIDDISTVRDSLVDPVSGKKIWYIINPNGLNLFRIKQTRPAVSNFAVKEGQPALLKLEQDSIFIMGEAVNRAISQANNKPGRHYFRISIFVNNLGELLNYKGAGLSEKINQVVTAKWQQVKGNALYSPMVPWTVIQKKGPAPGTDVLYLHAALQNYKNFFIPSAGLGIEMNFVKREVKTQLSLFTEFLFSFEKNAAGNLQTDVNEMISFSYGREPVKGTSAGMKVPLYFSLGYMVHTRGNVFDQHTFRLGAGRILLHNGAMRIEPVIYFNNLLKNASPGVRWIVNF